MPLNIPYKGRHSRGVATPAMLWESSFAMLILPNHKTQTRYDITGH